MRAASTAATAHATACSRMRSARTSRRSGSSSFESRNPRTRYVGSRITAAATTQPNSDPRPTSSTPATRRAPDAHALFSYLNVHRRRLSKRNFAAEGDSGRPDRGFKVEDFISFGSFSHLPTRRPNPASGFTRWARKYRSERRVLEHRGLRVPWHRVARNQPESPDRFEAEHPFDGAVRCSIKSRSQAPPWRLSNHLFEYARTLPYRTCTVNFSTGSTPAEQ